MRDTLLHLFRTHEEFRNYDTYAHCDNPGHGTFGSMKDPSKAMLGSFCHMLKDCSQKLATLCVGNNMNIIIPDIINAPMSEHDWTNWWTNYASKLSKATKKRNMLHANPIPPSADDFAVLRSNTLGLDGLLFLSQVGKLLDEKLFALPASPAYVGLPKQVYQPLINTQQQIRWDRIDAKDALCGIILCSDSQGHTLCGRITKKSMAVHHMENAQTLLNTTQQVQVGAYDSQNNWFTVTPL